MNRYTVYHSTGKRDGDAGFDSLDAAQVEYDDQKGRDSVVEIELIDNAGPDNPITIQSWSASDQK